MKLSDVSIERPVFAAMLITGLVVLGLISLSRLEMQMDPDIEFPFLYVVTDLRGASPGTVEREVTDVLEEHINSIEGIRTLSSVSSQGRSRISVEFGLGYEVYISKASTILDQVADTFYLKDAQQKKVTDPLRLAALERALKTIVAETTDG